MFTIFAHVGHDHTSEIISGLDHCTPIIIIAGIIIALLIAVIIYLLTTRQPKHKITTKDNKKTAK